MATDLKRQIAETFIRQARKSGMDKVTINGIVSECKISRQAFYYYYQDIVDVARFAMRERLRVTQDANEEADDPEKAVRIFAKELVSQFPMINLALNSKLRGELEVILIKELQDFFYTVFIHEKCGRDLSKKQIDFQSDLIACGITAFAIEHSGERNFDADVFAEQLWDMIKRTYGE